MTSPSDLDDLRARVAALEALCGDLYQFAGTVGAPLRVLDALAAAANGDDLPAVDLLPITADECEAVADLAARLQAVREALHA